MTKRKRTNGQVQTIQWQKEKGQRDRNRQYNEKKRKDKETRTDNTMTKRKRTNGQVHCPFVLFFSLYCLYLNVWLLITPLVSSNGDQYRSTGRKPPTCASWNCSRPEYSWNIAHWKLNNNQSINQMIVSSRTTRAWPHHCTRRIWAHITSLTLPLFIKYIQSSHWYCRGPSKEKGQTDKYRQYNDKKKKDKRTSTHNVLSSTLSLSVIRTHNWLHR
jgi:hypothetical protein